MRRFKFKVGERVKIRKDLVVAEKYYMADGETYDTFSKRMIPTRGEEATVMDIEEGKYKLDVDELHYYTDDMLIKFVDDKARKPYDDKKDVEDLINHMLNMSKSQIIDSTLDKGDEISFREITQN